MNSKPKKHVSGPKSFIFHMDRSMQGLLELTIASRIVAVIMMSSTQISKIVILVEVLQMNMDESFLLCLK